MVEGVGCGPNVRGEVADVLVATIGEPATEAVDFIEAIGEEEGVVVFFRLGAVLSEEGAALHIGVVVESDEREKGGGEVDKGHDFVAGISGGEGGEGFPFFRNVHDHGDADTGIVEVALSAGGGATVVSGVEADGVFGGSVFLELIQDCRL